MQKIVEQLGLKFDRFTFALTKLLNEALSSTFLFKVDLIGVTHVLSINVSVHFVPMWWSSSLK